MIAGGYGAGVVSLACFNPALAIGRDFASNGVGLGLGLVYTAFEIVGAVLATGFFKIVRPEEFGGEKGGPFAEMVSEFLGTFMLVLTVGLNMLGKSMGGAFSGAAAVACMIYALGNVSGGHFNPAVTLTAFASGRCPALTFAKIGRYWLVQLVSGIVAAFVSSGIHHGDSFKLGPGDGHTLVEAALAEFIATFFLCYIGLGVAVSSTTKNPAMFAFSIGSCVTVFAPAIGGISGCSINPALSAGIVASHHFADDGFYAFSVYTIVQLAAAIVAGHVFRVTHAVDTLCASKNGNNLIELAGDLETNRGAVDATACS